MPYLRFGHLPYASILEEVLTALEIPYGRMYVDSHPTGMVDMGQQRTRSLVPSLKGENYVVIGMGFARLNAQKKKAEFYGRSEDYKLGINGTHLDLLKSFQPYWEICIVSR